MFCRGRCGRSDQPGEKVDVNALAKEVASLHLREGRGSGVTRFEAHQGFPYGSVRFVEGAIVNKEAEAWAASGDAELVRCGVADEFRKNCLGMSRAVVAVCACGWHVIPRNQGVDVPVSDTDQSEPVRHRCCGLRKGYK